MINFFRKIRQKTLSENKFSKYLLYAIGEIVLVVIGILIALQINNWNQNRIRNIEEINVLKDIRTGLKKDKKDIVFNISRIKSSISSGDKVIYALENKLPYRDSISLYLGDLMFPVMFMHSTNAFETLKSKGIDLIKNPELRDEIISVYDALYNSFLKVETMMTEENERGIKHIFSTRFHEAYVYDLDKKGFDARLTPIEYNTLSSDQEFNYFLKTYKNRLYILLHIHYRARIQNGVERLLESIHEEIGRLEE